MLALSFTLVIIIFSLFTLLPFKPPYVPPGLLRGFLPSLLVLCFHLQQPIPISFPKMSDSFRMERLSIQPPSHIQKQSETKIPPATFRANLHGQTAAYPASACFHLLSPIPLCGSQTSQSSLHCSCWALCSSNLS